MRDPATAHALQVLQVLPQDHPAAASVQDNIGLVLRQRGKYDEAISMHSLALVTQSGRVGTKRQYAATWAKMASARGQQGEVAQAVELFKKALFLLHGQTDPEV